MLNPARLFKFPTRKRRISDSAPSSDATSITITDTKVKKRSRVNPVSQRERLSTAIISETEKKPVILPPPTVAAEESVAKTVRSTGIPKVKVLSSSPSSLAKSTKESNNTVRIVSSQADAPPPRRRRRSSGSLSLSPTSSYQQMSNTNEEELQNMVDLYLQLNHDDQSDKPTTVLKRPHRVPARRPSKVEVDEEEKDEREEKDAVHKTPHGTDMSATMINLHDETGDGEIEDYVYDVYYREKFLGSMWEGGQYGLL